MVAPRLRAGILSVSSLSLILHKNRLGSFLGKPPPLVHQARWKLQHYLRREERVDVYQIKKHFEHSNFETETEFEIVDTDFEIAETEFEIAETAVVLLQLLRDGTSSISAFSLANLRK